MNELRALCVSVRDYFSPASLKAQRTQRSEKLFTTHCAGEAPRELRRRDVEVKRGM
jgi:hypothetical protein